MVNRNGFLTDQDIKHIIKRSLKGIMQLITAIFDDKKTYQFIKIIPLTFSFI
jgi:hypothetical protein